MAMLSISSIFGSEKGIVPFRRRRPRRLVETLTDRKAVQSVSLLSQARSLKASGQQLFKDLFGDTREQYQLSLGATDEALAAYEAEQNVKRNISLAAVGLLFSTVGIWISPLFTLPAIAAIVFASRKVYFDAYEGLFKERRFDFRAVFALSVMIPLLSGLLWQMSLGAVLGISARYLSTRTQNRSKQTLVDMFGGQIHKVWLLLDGQEIECPIEQIKTGDTVVVQAGQHVPVDGVIVSGAAMIDQHMLTGESQPVERGEDDSVLASTVVLSGRIHVQVVKAGRATVAAQIGVALSQTDNFIGELQTRAERFANQMVMPVMGLSLLALPIGGWGAACAMLWYHPGFRMMFYGPLSMLSFLQLAAKQGILIKDGRSLELLEEVETVVFDKTGTLTTEVPTVVRISCFSGLSEATLLRFAAAAEAKQSHPIAQAILDAAKARELEVPTIEDIHYQVGLGLKVQIAGQVIRVGSVRFMEMEHISVPPSVVTQQMNVHTMGHSLVMVSVDDELAGTIELQPAIRQEAKSVIEMLHARGLETVIISGDHEEPTRRLAADLGIDRYYAQVLPKDKARLVREIQDTGKRVCFIGDGINDAIALKSADVSVSLRGATTIATDSAQVIFMGGSLKELPKLFELADACSANMRLNFMASVWPNVVGIMGTFLLGWGFATSVLLLQVTTPLALYNSVRPLLTQDKASPDALSQVSPQ